MRLTLVLAACGVAIVIMASGLRPDAFFVGDQGIKLAATRNVLHSPAHPLTMPLPVVGGDRLPHVEPFFLVHGDHRHAVTSELFPLLTAPLLAAFGLRGLYVLPAAGLLATLLGCAWLAVVLDRTRSAALVAATAALGTPFLFYSLEFWEHMPAVACGLLGGTLLLDAARRRPGRHAATPSSLAAGLLMGTAIVLRAEAAAFVVALAVASRTLVHRPTWRSLGVAAVGVAMALLPLAIYGLVHFGSIVPAHVTVNAGLVEGAWWTQRMPLAVRWLAPSRFTLDGPVASASLWAAGPVSLIALASLARGSERRERVALWIMAGMTLVLVLLTAPNDGGSQWGPRYLLFAYVPLAILASDLLQALPRRASTLAIVGVLIAVSVWVQRAAYRELRGTKRTYGRIVDFVARTAAPGVPVVSDLWWLDQLAAASLDDRTFMFVGDDESGRGLMTRLSDHTVPTTTIVRSHDSLGGSAPWWTGTCYFEEGRDTLDVRGLVAIRLRHRCGYVP